MTCDGCIVINRTLHAQYTCIQPHEDGACKCVCKNISEEIAPLDRCCRISKKSTRKSSSHGQHQMRCHRSFATALTRNHSMWHTHHCNKKQVVVPIKICHTTTNPEQRPTKERWEPPARTARIRVENFVPIRWKRKFWNRHCTRGVPLCVTHSFIWLVDKCDMTRLYVWHDSLPQIVEGSCKEH